MVPPQPDPPALSLPFAKGLMAGIVDVLGASGGTPALLQWMIREMFPRYQEALPNRDDLASFNPLYPYYRHLFGPLVPVPYRYLTYLRQGLDVLNTPRASEGMALRIGQHWWQGEPPFQQHRSTKDTLQYLLTPSMLDVLHAARLEYVSKIRPITPDQPSTPLEPDEPLFLGIVCRAFAAALVQQGGIHCQVESTQQYTAVSFPYCPFCANQLPSCNLLRGVVEAMLLWAYRQPNLDSLATAFFDYRLEMTLWNADSHHIRLILGEHP
jgi:hypothetical protein